MEQEPSPLWCSDVPLAGSHPVPHPEKCGCDPQICHTAAHCGELPGESLGVSLSAWHVQDWLGFSLHSKQWSFLTLPRCSSDKRTGLFLHVFTYSLLRAEFKITVGEQEWPKLWETLYPDNLSSHIVILPVLCHVNESFDSLFGAWVQ